MFWPRLISGIVLVLIAFLGFSIGTPVLGIIVYAISMIGYHELLKAMDSDIDRQGRNILEIVGLVGTTIYYLLMLAFDCNLLEGDRTLCLLGGVIFLFFAEIFTYVFTYPVYRAEEVAFSIFAFIYAPVMLSFIESTRVMQGGKYIVWIILISSWGCDTCAYVVGKTLGKHKIFPKLSPKKSLEGCIGGVAGSAIIGVLFAKFVFMYPPTQLGEFAVVCAIAAIASMIGDLAASAIKRNKGIKDYGKLIPGHGGIMDRFDSVIVTAPFVYFLASLILSR